MCAADENIKTAQIRRQHEATVQHGLTDRMILQRQRAHPAEPGRVTP
jgi:hypothetical protein